jgi:hypothetical protein
MGRGGGGGGSGGGGKGRSSSGGGGGGSGPQALASIGASDVAEFTKNSQIKGVLTHYTTAEGKHSIETRGFDPARNTLGVYGSGLYTTTGSKTTATAFRGLGGHEVRIAIDARKVVTGSASQIKSKVKAFETANPGPGGKARFSAHLRSKGYDAIVVKQPRQPAYVVAINPAAIRIVP